MTAQAYGQTWPGSWVADRLQVRLDAQPGPLTVTDLVGMAIRRNPRRAHLLVSTALGKHVPTDPRVVLGAGLLLGVRVADRILGTNSELSSSGARLLTAALAGSKGSAAALGRLLRQAQSRPGTSAVVLGFAETATALGHSVADVLSADYLHSTRRAVAQLPPLAIFEEAHSHASQHLLLPEHPALLSGDQPLVLVDDELSTGSTARNAIRALHRFAPRRDRYLLACLVDLRSPAEQSRLAALATELGVRIEVVALATGQLSRPPDVLQRAARVIAAYRADAVAPVRSPAGRRTTPPSFRSAWPAGVREGGRHGFGAAHRAPFERAVAGCAAELAYRIGGSGPDEVLVLGSEELMYAPLRIAGTLADLLEATNRDVRVRYASTTRSPILVVDEDGYAVRSGLAFPAPERRADGQRYAYNIAPDPVAGRFSDVVLVVDDVADTPELAAGLTTQLAGFADRLHLLRIPSYQPSAGRAPQTPTCGAERSG